MTPAWYAIYKNSPEILDLLLEYGASTYYLDKHIPTYGKESEQEFREVLHKHNRWRRVRPVLKAIDSEQLDGAESLKGLHRDLHRMVLREYL